VQRHRQRLLHGALALAVQVGGGLVQDHDRRRLEQQPGDRDPLLLTARQPVDPGEQF
jgi:hypothetical protein